MGFREMRGGDGVSDVEIRRNEIIELLYTFKMEIQSSTRNKPQLYNTYSMRIPKDRVLRKLQNT